MAIRADASGDKLSRSTTLPTNGTFTVMGWFKLSVDINNYAGFMCMNLGGTSELYVGTNGNGTTLISYNPDADGPAGSTLTVGTWYHIAMVCNGTSTNNLLVYLNGVLDTTFNGKAGTSTVFTIFARNNNGDASNACGAAVKVYSAVLTSDEILNEAGYYVPLRMVNLNTWLPMVEPVVANNAIDFSGIGGNMTVGGTLTVEDGPPIAWAPVSEDVMGMAYDVAAGFPGVEGVPLFGCRVGVGVIPLPVMIPVSV